MMMKPTPQFDISAPGTAGCVGRGWRRAVGLAVLGFVAAAGDLPAGNFRRPAPNAAVVLPNVPAVWNPTYRVGLVANNGMSRDIVACGSDWNFGSGVLWTHEGWQYAAYWDAPRQVSVARRQLPNGPWAVVSLPGYQRSETGDRGKGGAVSCGFGDGHEKVEMGISADGHIHLAFDHHVSTVHYRRTKLPVAANPAAHAWRADLFGGSTGGCDTVKTRFPL